MITPYTPDRSFAGKIRRRMTRLVGRRSAQLELTGPVVSFTFDDVPASAIHAGASVLEAADARGTFYISAGLFDAEGHMGRFANASETGDLIRRGHEVGGHTFNHIDCHRTPTPSLLADIQSNDERLSALGAANRHFAYPYGEVSARAKCLLASRYASLRGVHKGLVHEDSDLNQLPAVGIEGTEGESLARAWIDRAISERAWLILYTHDVQDAPSEWGCTPCTLSRLVHHALAQGAAIKTLGQVIP